MKDFPDVIIKLGLEDQPQGTIRFGDTMRSTSQDCIAVPADRIH